MFLRFNLAGAFAHHLTRPDLRRPIAEPGTPAIITCQGGHARQVRLGEIGPKALGAKARRDGEAFSSSGLGAIGLGRRA